MELEFQYDFPATMAALLHLAGKGLPFDKYRACKLLFLADREHLLRFGRPITGDNYSALPFGPTPAQTSNLLDQLEEVLVEGKELPEDPRVKELTEAFNANMDETPHPRYVAKTTPDLEMLSETDVLVLDEVAARYGSSSFGELKALTHALKAYSKVWMEDPTRRRFGRNFEDFFEDEPGKAGFLKEIQAHQFLKTALSAHRD